MSSLTLISRVPGKTTEHFLEKVTFPKPLFLHIRKMFKNSNYTQNVSTNVRQTDYPNPIENKNLPASEEKDTAISQNCHLGAFTLAVFVNSCR